MNNVRYLTFLLLSFLSITAFALPDLDAKCSNLNLVNDREDYTRSIIFDEDCSTVYVAPPAVNHATHIELLDPLSDRLYGEAYTDEHLTRINMLCSSFDNLLANGENLSFKLFDVMMKGLSTSPVIGVSFTVDVPWGEEINRLKKLNPDINIEPLPIEGYKLKLNTSEAFGTVAYSDILFSADYITVEDQNGKITPGMNSEKLLADRITRLNIELNPLGSCPVFKNNRFNPLSLLVSSKEGFNVSYKFSAKETSGNEKDKVYTYNRKVGIYQYN